MTPAIPRVLVTRAAEDAAALSHALSQAGLQPVEVPALLRRWDIEAVASLAARAGDADLLVVTSPTVADVIATAAPRAWAHARVAAVGPATQRRLEDLGWSVDVRPERSTAADLLQALGEVDGLTVAWPRAELAAPETAQTLREGGATVHEAVAYTNVEPPGLAAQLAQALPVEAVTLMSGSAARRIAAHVPPAERWKLGRVVVIGPSTAAAAVANGLDVARTADPHSIAGLLAALQTLDLSAIRH